VVLPGGKEKILGPLLRRRKVINTNPILLHLIDARGEPGPGKKVPSLEKKIPRLVSRSERESGKRRGRVRK